jgi:hypothetical protein
LLRTISDGWNLNLFLQRWRTTWGLSEHRDTLKIANHQWGHNEKTHGILGYADIPFSKPLDPLKWWSCHLDWSEEHRKTLPSARWCPRSRTLSWASHNSNFTMVFVGDISIVNGLITNL